jgi:hypothetical protein
MTTVFVSGANERYGFHLLNLLGSVRANSPVFDRYVVYDLGLSAQQRRLVEAVRGVELATVPPFVPHWAQGFTWKTWIWTHTEADVLFWLDAGASVLRSLEEPLAQVAERGYFVVGQGHPAGDLIPSDYYALYGLDAEVGEREAIWAGGIGFETDGEFYDRVIVPTFGDAQQGRSLGFSSAEAARVNFGLNRTDDVLLRDCLHFRWDQSLLNIHFYETVEQPVVNPLREYAGFETPHDHPEQLIWHHRRRGDFRYLWRVPYERRARPAAWWFTARFKWRFWLRSSGWKLKPSRFVGKVRRILAR